MKKIKYIISIFISINMLFIAACAESINEIPTNLLSTVYDINYTISGNSMNILYTIENEENIIKTVSIIAVMYKSGVMSQVASKSMILNNNGTGFDTIEMIIPEIDKEYCSVKMMVWENAESLRPIGKSKMIKDIEPYLREKVIIVSKNSGQKFKIYMNSENVIGDNIEADHIIKFNPQKFEVVDLCGLTYEKELAPGKIENTGITIQSIDAQNGKIIFNFDLSEGRNTGINNIVKFRALSDVSGEEIIYEIQ